MTKSYENKRKMKEKEDNKGRIITISHMTICYIITQSDIFNISKCHK